MPVGSVVYVQVSAPSTDQTSPVSFFCSFGCLKPRLTCDVFSVVYAHTIGEKIKQKPPYPPKNIRKQIALSKTFFA